MDKSLEELSCKIKTLKFRMNKTNDVIDKRDREALERQRLSVASSATVANTIKETIEESMFAKGETEEKVKEWSQEVEVLLAEADQCIRLITNELKDIEAAAQESVILKEQQQKLQFEKELTEQRLRQEQESVEEKRKLDLEHHEKLKEALNCDKVVRCEDRKKIFAEKHLCFNCAGGKHRAVDCKSKGRCQTCGGKHHTTLCDKNQKPREPGMTASHIGPSSVIHPVVVVRINGYKFRALLDSGANHSYASSTAINLIGAKVKSTGLRQIATLTGVTARTMQVYAIKMDSLSDDFNVEVNLTKIEKKELLFLENPHYKEIIRNHSHLRGVDMDDDDDKDILPVYILLGANDYAKVRTSENLRVGRIGEPVAEHTKFGWSIMSPGAEQETSLGCLAVNSIADYDNLCSLDMLDLADPTGPEDNIFNKPNVNEPNVNEPNVNEPNMNKPNLNELNVSQPNVNKPDQSQHNQNQPDQVQQGIMPVDGDKEGTDVQPGRNTDTSNEPPSQQGATNVNQPDLPKVPSNVNRLPSYGPPAWNTAIFVPPARQLSYGEIVQPRISGRLRKNHKPSEERKVKKEPSLVGIEGKKQSSERNRNRWPMGIVKELIKGKDGVVRAAKLKSGRDFLECTPQHLCPLELSCGTFKRKDGENVIVQKPVELNPNAPRFMPKRHAAAEARRRIYEQLRDEQTLD
ncbi:Tumor necrosis factor receptor superfamily member 19 [Paramuricea clavata]|uniref:Tumor necrosis factor receptor superfamily member 19 n=1 Tax=Paramuricea clavata TaxID=317549 RepID=A0A6S7JT59_PARCT|nr:Tumor necrosis factor receptor superfamily member 19 [Paramuricea clavata]